MVKQKLEPPVEMGLGSKAKILALNELEYWAMRREGHPTLVVFRQIQIQ